MKNRIVAVFHVANPITLSRVSKQEICLPKGCPHNAAIASCVCGAIWIFDQICRDVKVLNQSLGQIDFAFRFMQGSICYVDNIAKRLWDRRSKDFTDFPEDEMSTYEAKRSPFSNASIVRS